MTGDNSLHQLPALHREIIERDKELWQLYDTGYRDTGTPNHKDPMWPQTRTTIEDVPSQVPQFADTRTPFAINHKYPARQVPSIPSDVRGQRYSWASRDARRRFQVTIAGVRVSGDGILMLATEVLASTKYRFVWRWFLNWVLVSDIVSY